MAKKLKRTRLELKHQRDALNRYARFLPLLKLKQQQLQMTLNELRIQRGKAADAAEQARQVVDRYRSVLADPAGVNVAALAKPEHINTSTANVAGVTVPVFEDVTFAQAEYSLFFTPPWVDRALADLRELARRRAVLEVLDRQFQILHRELSRIIQRVNLFEKVMIPRCRQSIRVIRIQLGDEMTAAVVRAKIAKGKLAATEQTTAPVAAGEGARP